jgi:hypothetical protein
MSVEVYDNLFDENNFNKLKSIVESVDFPWTRSRIVNEDHHQVKINNRTRVLMDRKYNHQFVHFLYENSTPRSEFSHEVLKLFIQVLDDKVPIRSILRAKVNFNSCTENIVEHAFHHDYNPTRYPDLKTVLFYINTNDGYTLFEDGNKVESVANRCVIMTKNILHTGTNCTNDFGRIVVVINYL